MTKNIISKLVDDMFNITLLHIDAFSDADFDYYAYLTRQLYPVLVLCALSEKSDNIMHGKHQGGAFCLAVSDFENNSNFQELPLTGKNPRTLIWKTKTGEIVSLKHVARLFYYAIDTTRRNYLMEDITARVHHSSDAVRATAQKDKDILAQLMAHFGTRFDDFSIMNDRKAS
jgi:hypothetical protein